MTIKLLFIFFLLLLFNKKVFFFQFWTETKCVFYCNANLKPMFSDTSNIEILPVVNDLSPHDCNFLSVTLVYAQNWKLKINEFALRALHLLLKRISYTAEKDIFLARKFASVEISTLETKLCRASWSRPRDGLE